MSKIDIVRIDLFPTPYQSEVEKSSPKAETTSTIHLPRQVATNAAHFCTPTSFIASSLPRSTLPTALLSVSMSTLPLAVTMKRSPGAMASSLLPPRLEIFLCAKRPPTFWVRSDHAAQAGKHLLLELSHFLLQLIPNAPTGTALCKVALRHQRAKMQLERVAIATGQSQRIRHGDASMLACELDNL